MIKILIDYIYPECCAFCGKLNRNALCKKCEIKFKKKALFRVENYKDTSSYFDEHIFIFHYDGEIRKIILDYKFNDKSYIYKTFVNFLKNNYEICVQIKKYDIIIPVPISKEKYKKRGYNQSGIFAKSLAKELKMKYGECLAKTKNNATQSLLNQEGREKNVQGVYKAKNIGKIKNKNILLVDDIFTTGYTVNECSKILKEANAKSVGILTIAKD